MAISELAGSETLTAASPITRHSLATDTSYDTGDAQTDDGVVQAFIDVADMVAGDQLSIRVLEKVRGGSPGDLQQIVYEAILTGAQAQPVFVTPALTLMHGWDVTASALAGTIKINWSIRRIPVA
jgi:hypothetical protein